MPTDHDSRRRRPAAGAGALTHLFLGRPRTRKGHFDALDGLRGLAVLVVMASHLSLLGWLPGISLGGSGKSGVYLFFVLSAFLLTRVLLERTPREFADARLWAGYALRRVLRIWPLYLVVLLSSWWLTRTGHATWHFQLDTADLLDHLALREGESVLWSIPVEFKYYFWLPWVAFGLAWMAHRRWSLAAQASVAAVAAAGCLLTWPPDATAVNDVRLGPYLVLFLCGAFAATLDRRLASRPPSPLGWGLAATAVLGALAATVPAAWAALTGSPLDLRLNHTWFLFFGVAWSILLLAVLHGPGPLRAAFAWAPMRLLGVVSFSAYLWHLPVLFWLRDQGARQWPAAAAWVVAAILVVSMASFLLVERPWREVRLRERASPRPHGRPDGDGKIARPSRAGAPRD